MTWINANWFKLSTLLIIIVFGVYYLSIVLPSQDIDKKVSECRKSGENYGKREVAENPTLSFSVPKYTYNKSLDTCLFSRSFIDTRSQKSLDDAGFIYEYIIDINTNETLFYSAKRGGELVDGIDSTEFSQKEQELFERQ